VGKPEDAARANDLGREVCQSVGANVVVDASLGRGAEGFVIKVDARDCRTGNYIARTGLQAESKEHVLGTIWKATADLRHGMGESLRSIQDNDIANWCATSSLEAFKAYMEASELHDKGDNAGSIPFFKQATELDPDFAAAYLGLGHAYAWVGSTQGSVDALSHAFALRERTGSSTRLIIEGTYYTSVSGEIFKALDAFKRSEIRNPDEFSPHNILGLLYGQMGDYQNAERELRETLRVAPNSAIPYSNLGFALLVSDQFDKLRTLLTQASTQPSVDSPDLHELRFETALTTEDAAALEKEETWSRSTSEQMAGLKIRIEEQVERGLKNEARLSANSAVQIAARSNLT
jgi:eukaryotic-like serine/threonine-protein kinase